MTDQRPGAVPAGESKLTILNKKIAEMKKKIQLSEGQRKASFEETNAKKREYVEKIGQLKKEVKELHTELTRIKNNEESSELTNSLSREASTLFSRARKTSADEKLAKTSEDVMRLKKKYDLLTYRKEKLQRNLATLTYEYDELKRKKRGKSSKKKQENPLKPRIIELEVRLERMRAMQIKVDITRRKLKTVRADLKEQSISYASTLKELEDGIKEQEAEIKRLQGVKEEAVQLRDKTRKTLEKEENDYARASKEREREIEDYRRRVAEKRSELERLERAIFPARPRDNFEARENDGRVADEDVDASTSSSSTSRLAATLGELRAVTGAASAEDVPSRILGQRETRRKLGMMREAREREKSELERRRQELVDEIDARKFDEARNADRNAGTLERLQERIREERARRERAEAEEQRMQELINQAIHCLIQLFEKIPGVTESEIYEDPRSVDDPSRLTEVLLEKINVAVEAANAPENTPQPTVTEKFDAISLGTTSAETKTIQRENVPLFPCFPSTGTPAAPSEDEEEIPTRNALKRRAQVLLDTKSRRKGFNFRR